jgi:RNA polymerase sigma-70 factor (ECF subfamily)
MSEITIPTHSHPRAQPPRRDDEDLHAAIANNDEDWQRRAFEHLHGLVHGLILKCLGPNAEIADLVGDVFLTFFETAHRIRRSAALRSYVVSITMNAVRREIRRRKRRQVLGGSSRTPPELDHEPGHDDPKAKAALIQLSRILDELGKSDRMAFVLHSLEGMQIAEIASALEVSQSTAKRRVRRANEHVLKRVSRNALLGDYLQEKGSRTRR